MSNRQIALCFAVVILALIVAVADAWKDYQRASSVIVVTFAYEGDHIPIATLNKSDMSIFRNARETAVYPANLQTLIDLRSTGRILAVEVGTRAQLLENDGHLSRVHLLAGIHKNIEGWIDNRNYYAEGQPHPLTNKEIRHQFNRKHGLPDF